MLVPPVAVVGAGRVGSALEAALRRAGVAVTGVVRRADDAATRAAALDAAGLVLLAVPDDAIAAVAASLDTLGADVALAHASGRHGVAVLGERPRRLALHPVMTFAGTARDADRLAGTTWGVTADDDVRPLAEAFVAALGGNVAWVAEAQRALYHAALANAANHLVTLVAQSAAWLADAGVAAPYDALSGLTQTALGNVLALGDEALTGPVARDDVAALRAHLAALPEGTARAAYVALARLTAERADATSVFEALRSVG